MSRRTSSVVLAACAALATIVSGARADVETTVRDLARSVRENYVFPEVGEKAAAMLEANLESGAYDDIDGIMLAQRLTTDLQQLTHDRHFRVFPAPPDAGPASEPEDEPAPTGPLGFRRIERLDGNIGYVDMTEFARRQFAEPMVHAAMQLLQGSDALIFDMRGNGGGDPETVQAMCTYLFDPGQPVHLNSLYNRPTDTTREFWTQPEILKCDAMPDTPVWVLTSNFTFSGAEEFTYNLKTRKRATIVGERTGGGAHPVDPVRLEGGPFVAMIPVGRAINPVTGDDWEGTGIEPDVVVPAGDALDTAIGLALETLSESDDPVVADRAAWGLIGRRVAAGGEPIDEPAMREIAGDYGERQIEVRDGGLWYSRAVAAAGWRRLICVGEDTFVLEGVPGFRLEVDRSGDGDIKGLRGIYRQGLVDYSERTD
ncbi:MAG: S41 family peptidase [Phycisphaeraceae bacterium]|nr:MAG: S41 family peptidase [Phycisphaeraceae bacterium]